MPTRPKEVDQIIKKYTRAKVPYFFQFAKNKNEEQCEIENDSPMNRLSKKFRTPRMTYMRRMAKVDYRYMLSDMNFCLTDESQSIIELYDYWNKRQKILFNTTDENHTNQEDLWLYQQIRDRILNSTDKDIDFVVNTLVTLYYTTRNFSQKKMLWGCFGDVILNNLKKNCVDLGKICLICGHRFESQYVWKTTCRPECGHKLDIINKRLRRSGDPTLGSVEKKLNAGI